VSDPIGDGFVSSLAQPGGNITGFSTFDPEIGGKWLKLLKETAPATRRVGLLFNPKTAPGGGSFFLHPLFDGVARRFGLETISLPVQDTTAIEASIAELSIQPNSALVVMPDSFTIAHREIIVGLINLKRACKPRFVRLLRLCDGKGGRMKRGRHHAASLLSPPGLVITLSCR
jgi:putative tryptophan/tyrosine transport system substrate-binding protein